MTLEDQTQEAFGRTKNAMSSIHQGVASNAGRIAELESTPAIERQWNRDREQRLHKEQQAIVDNLTQQLEDALARVDRVSTDLAKECSVRDLQPQ